MLKSLSVLGLAAVLLLAGTARAEQPRIAVTGVGGDKASPQLRDKMARAIAAGLVASGADVRTEPSPVAYRVQGTLNVEGRNYTLRLEILDVKTGAVLDVREDRCEICTEGEALETAGISASALKSQVFKRRPALAIDAGGIAAHPPAAAVRIQAPPPGPPPEPPRASSHRGLGVAAMLVGAVAAGTGAWLLSMHNDPTDCDGTGRSPEVACQNRWNTVPSGVGLISAGALAITAGVLALTGVF